MPIFLTRMLSPPSPRFGKVNDACVWIRWLSLVTRELDIEMVCEVRWHHLPRLSFGEDCADALDAASDKSRTYLLPINAYAKPQGRKKAKSDICNREPAIRIV
jgi:hypothetical protein